MKTKKTKVATTNATRKTPTTPVNRQYRPPQRAQIRRLGMIHKEVASGKFPNKRSLAQFLRVSQSTIKRDLMLIEMDYPLEYNKTKHGYYFDGPADGTKGLPVSRREMIAALFLMQGMEYLQGTCWEAAIETICEKIAEGFPDIVTFHPSDWQKVMSNRSNGKTVVTPENLELLVKAIHDRETLHVQNYNQKGDVSQRDLDPLHIQRFEDNLYLIAYDHKNKKELTFGAWRLKPITRTGRHFEKPIGFDPNKFFEGSFGIYADKDAIPRHIVLGFSKRVAVMIQERLWNGQQKIETMPDGSVNLHLQLKGLLEVSRLILRWGPDVVDIHPDDLFEMYGGYLKQMNENYAAMLVKQAERKKAAVIAANNVPGGINPAPNQANAPVPSEANANPPSTAV